MVDGTTQHSSPAIVIKGGGEMASGVATRLFRAGLRRILMLEIPAPLAVRRTVCFSEAVYDGRQVVEDIPARLVHGREELEGVWREGCIAVAVDPRWNLMHALRPRVTIDALVSKRNTGTRLDEAPLVLALGPGFTAGVDAHVVIETRRGHNLGKVYREGAAEANTGVPGTIGGYTVERLLRSPTAGVVHTNRRIGEKVRSGETLLEVNGMPVVAAISGVLRGLIRPGITVDAQCKLGDIDPRGEPDYCRTVSEKARALGGAVLEVICADAACWS
jgi:xanthine dehydrogenase accessory factor